MIRMMSVAAFAGVLAFPASSATRALTWVADDFEVIMRTHGQITFAPYIHGGSPRNDFSPGYRSDFYAYVDFFSWKGLVSNWLIANSTVIERSDTTAFRLERIRYTLTPGYQYEFDTWMISGLLLHECIHAIGRDEPDGSIWWNSFRFGFGTKGAYPQFLVQRYSGDFTRFTDRWDWQVNVGAFLYGRESVWLAQNNDYRYEEFALLRYHLGRRGRWGSYADLNQALWIREGWKTEQKWSLTLNLLLRGSENMAGLYYTWFMHDSNTQDNEDRLGALGFKIVF
jgi:hypothetical protein